MADKIEEFPQKSVTRRFDWSRFLDGQIWSLQRSVDFDVELATARAGLYMACRRKYGITHRVRCRQVALNDNGHEVMVVQRVAR